MKLPRIPPMAVDIIQTALSAMDGAVFSELAACPCCGGTVTGYDFKTRQFALLEDHETHRTIHVKVKRFRCRECGRLCYADQPFYPDTRIGSPVIDLSITLTAGMPATRAARVLSSVGISVDRTSCLLFARRFQQEIRTADVFGMRLPFSVLALSNLAAQNFENEPLSGSEVLAACGFPSAYQPGPVPDAQDKYDMNNEEPVRKHVRSPDPHNDP